MDLRRRSCSTSSIAVKAFLLTFLVASAKLSNGQLFAAPSRRNLRAAGSSTKDTPSRKLAAKMASQMMAANNEGISNDVVFAPAVPATVEGSNDDGDDEYRSFISSVP